MVVLNLGQVCTLGMPKPIFMDWVDLSVFFLSITLVYLAMFRAEARDKKGWYFVSVSLILLALNKFLFIDNCIKDGLASIAIHNNLYAGRRVIQALLMVFLFALLTFFFFKFRQRALRINYYLKWSYWGLICLFSLVLLRTISLHQVDGIIYPDLPGIGIGLNWVIEISANLLIAVYAAAYAKSNNKIRKG